MVFHTIDTEEVIDRFVAPCFVNGLEAYDGEINLRVEENLISNEYVVKLCLEHEVKRGNKIVKKELNVIALRGEIYFVKFIINPEEDDVEPEVIFRRSFLRMAKAITDFRAGTITIYHDIDPFLEDNKEEEKEEASKEALAIRISQKFALLEEKDKVELDRMIMKEYEEAMKKVKGKALKEKDDPEAFIFPIRLEGQVNENALADTGSDINTMPYRIYEQLGKEEMKKLNRGIIMINHIQAEAMGILTNTINDAESNHRDPNALDNLKPWKKCCFHKFTMSSCYGEDVLNEMGCDGEINDMLRIKFREAKSNEEIFTSVAWIRAFDIKEPIYADLCHEFYSTYKFDKVCADDELQTKKIIKFRLGGRAYNLTLLEFAHRSGLYHADELEEDGFDRGEFKFVKESYLYYQEPNFGVIHKMITYVLCQRTTGYDKIQKNDLWLLSMFDARHQIWVHECGLGDCEVDEEKRRWYSKGESNFLDLVTTMLRELIDSEVRLIPEDPQPGVSRVGIPRPPRASMQDLYDRIGSMEIRQEAIERMEYR
nr:hypothetical protein [Tanacetum cinerariifolium]